MTDNPERYEARPMGDVGMTFHTFTLVISIEGDSEDEARDYLMGLLEVGDGEERITNVERHDGDLLSRDVWS